MAQWMVTQGSTQFGVDGLTDLKKMAQEGRLSPGDMVQPPGTTEWLYASEVSELRGLLREPDDDGGSRGGGMTGLVVGLGVAAALVVVLCVGGFSAMYAGSFLGNPDTKILGAGGLSFSELVVTQATVLRSAPDDTVGGGTSLSKDDKLLLLAKRDNFYKAKGSSGMEGWVRIDEVLPVYKLGDSKIKAEYDPLYNPDQYVKVMNASWMMVDDRTNKDKVTTFQFLMKNESKYPMTDLVLLGTIKDSKGSVVGTQEFAIEGEIPPFGETFVGTLNPEEPKGRKPKPEDAEKSRLMTVSTFMEMAKTDEDLNLRWVDGVEVGFKADFVQAEIRIVELRAAPIPKEL